MRKPLFILWCLIWPITVVGVLAHSPPGGHWKPSPAAEYFKLFSLLNGLIFYLGGGTWLLRRCIQRFRDGRRGDALFALAAFACLNIGGPMVLLLCDAILNPNGRNNTSPPPGHP